MDDEKLKGAFVGFAHWQPFQKRPFSPDAAPRAEVPLKPHLARETPPTPGAFHHSLIPVEAAELVVVAIGTVAGIAGAYFGRRTAKAGRRRPPPTPKTLLPAAAPAAGGPTAYDVFISYTHADAELVTDLAGRLRRHGIAVAYDELILPGDTLVHSVEKLLLESADGLLVYSPAALASRWVRDEYAVLMQRSIEEGRLFIPVLTAGVEKTDLPPFAQARMHSDLRGASDEEFDREVERIATALRAARR